VSFLLDTNICSAHFRSRRGLTHRFIQHGGRLFVPTIVLGELYAGAYKVDRPTPLLRGIEDLLAAVKVLPYDQQCAEVFGVTRGGLLRRGISVPSVDLMIAAVALAHDLTLVTHNTADFANVPGLRLEDWLAP
jgi:tRNA(fMet)-specific endonuclease VapC